jgi:NADPH2:quinone reductase
VFVAGRRDAGPAEGVYDLVVDATGAVPVIEHCFAYARPAGKVWLFGVAPSDARASLSPYHVFRNDLTIFGSFALNRTFPRAIALASSGRVKLAPLVSHSLPLSEFSRGFELAGSPEAMKVQYVM